MASLNVNLPRFYCLLRKEFLYDGQSHHGEFVKVCVFGAASIPGRAIGFHVLTENGAVIWRLPLHALCHKPDAPVRPLDWLQFWDCFSCEVSCTVFDRLRDCRVGVRLRDRSNAGGQYMFTLDWHGSEDAEEAGDGGHKCAHVIALDEGNFAAQPNNRLQWFCPAFVTPLKERPDYVTNTAVWKVERETETTQAYFYEDPSRGSQESQVRLYVKGLRT
ncbi:MAG TPA: hypothetical protein VHN77_04480 [Phycisphaerales bacterium]|nr:hypothetical protein [Phycisphaerales bacterium]